MGNADWNDFNAALSRLLTSLCKDLAKSLTVKKYIQYKSDGNGADIPCDFCNNADPLSKEILEMTEGDDPVYAIRLSGKTIAGSKEVYELYWRNNKKRLESLTAEIIQDLMEPIGNRLVAASEGMKQAAIDEWSLRNQGQCNCRTAEKSCEKADCHCDHKEGAK